MLCTTSSATLTKYFLLWCILLTSLSRLARNLKAPRDYCTMVLAESDTEVCLLQYGSFTSISREFSFSGFFLVHRIACVEDCDEYLRKVCTCTSMLE